MKRLSWEVQLGLFLITLSVVIYLIHYMIFRDPHHIFIYMTGDIAFLPIEALLVVLIIERLLNKREKQERLEKLNMIIGAFFSEVGTKLLAYLSNFDPKLDEIRKDLIITDEWSDQEFLSVSRRLKNYDHEVKIQKINLEHLHSFLEEKRNLLMILYPNLLEHGSFSELLRAVYHLTQELSHRKDLIELPDSDYEHLEGDIKRAYVLLVHEWVDYMRYLKDNYPYFFSLAMRTNPFDQDASPIVK